jgi:hypothetical protein
MSFGTREGCRMAFCGFVMNLVMDFVNVAA